MARRRGLGKGLDALIPGGPELGPPSGASQDIPLALIQRNPRQPRKDMDPTELEGLAASIREHGLLQPVVVSPLKSGDGYRLIAGQRRLDAARLAGLDAVPAIVRQVNEQQRLEMALIENLQREDLNALEAAEGYRQLAEEFGLSHEDIAARIGKSRSAVSNTIRLLRLAPKVRAALSSGRISEGHARALLGVRGNKAQTAVLKTIVDRGLNVRQAEALVKRAGAAAKPKKQESRSPDEADLEGRLESVLGTRVRIRRGKVGGRLTIDFYSDEELNAIADRLLGEEDGA